MGNTPSAGQGSSSGNQSGGNSSGDLSGRRRVAIGTHRSVHLPPLSSLPSPFRSGGNLGLSRAELDARCRPSG